MMDKRLIQRAAAVLEQEFGSDWLTIAQQLGTENLRQRVGKELTQENISYTSDQGKTYDFNTADKLNTLLITLWFLQAS